MTMLGEDRYYHRDGSFFTRDSLEWAVSGISRPEFCMVAEDCVGANFVTTMFTGGVDFNVMSSVYPGKTEPLLFETFIFSRQATANDRLIKAHFYYHTEQDAILSHNKIVSDLQLVTALPCRK